MLETNAAPPDLSPNPVPEWDKVQQDVTTAEAFLKHVSGDPEDPRSDPARRLLERNTQTGGTRLEEVARIAHRVACQPLDTPLETAAPFLGEMWALIFNYSENSGDHISPLDFDNPPALLNVLEFAHIWHALATEPLTAFSTRQLARLARVDTKTIEEQLDLDRVPYEPYGISLSEMAEMTAAERLFWLGQNFVFGLKDATGWLAKFPGFTPKKAVVPVACVS